MAQTGGGSPTQSKAHDAHYRARYTMVTIGMVGHVKGPNMAIGVLNSLFRNLQITRATS